MGRGGPCARSFRVATSCRAEGEEVLRSAHRLAEAAVEFAPSDNPAGIHIRAEVKVTGPTGVEMEALTAVSVAALTIYDMLKAADRAMRIESVRLIEKSGGRSGTYKADPLPKPA